MNFLVFDTSCDNLTIALKKGNELLGYKSQENRKGHSTVLLPEINNLLEKAKLSLKDIDYFGAVVGPGSFTGIRVGVATVNAFGYATGKKVIGVTSFEPFAYNVQDGKTIAIDAKHAFFLATKQGEKLIYTTDEEHVLQSQATLIDQTDLTPEMLEKVMMDKIEKNEFEKTIRPFYMRASEAERNLKK